MKAHQDAIETIMSQHPRMAKNVVGHYHAKSSLLKAAISKTSPNAWLFSGEKGIGKATLAYHYIGKLLSNNLEDSWEAPLPPSPAIAKLKAGSHPDVMVIEPGEGASEIKVDAVREIGHFLHLTAAETPFRIVIIDSVDDLNTNAANAVLKLLEEPPAQAMMILISHNPHRLLPTIQSRCRKLSLQPLLAEETSKVLTSFIDDDMASLVGVLSQGAPGIAMQLLAQDGVDLYEKIVSILLCKDRFPKKEALAVAQTLSVKAQLEKWQVCCVLLEYILKCALKRQESDSQVVLPGNYRWDCPHPLGTLPALYEKMTMLISDTKRIHLDKKVVMLELLSLLWGRAY